MQPKVSIIMPAYNSAQFIAESINSVLQQSWTNWELIIVDDCSTDNTVKIANEFSSIDGRIVVEKNAMNLGPAHTRNAGISLATGQYLAFLDSDDIWYSNKLELQVNFMRHSQVDLIGTDYHIIDGENNRIGIKQCPAHLSVDRLLKKNTLGCLTVMVNFEKHPNLRMPDIRMRQDLGLWLKILQSGGRGVCLPVETAAYRVHNKSLTKNKLKAAYYTWKLYGKVLELSIGKRIFYFSHYAYNGLYDVLKTHLANMKGKA